LNQRFDYSHSDISRLAGVAPRSLDRILRVLLDEKLLIKTRKSGKAYMYMFNINSEKAIALEQYFKETMKSDIDFIKNPNNEAVENLINQQTLQAELRKGTPRGKDVNSGEGLTINP
jgi:hypothetical protein